MTRLVWDQGTNNPYGAGVDRGVFYPISGPGQVWNGLTSVQESPSDAGETIRHIDGVKTRTRQKPGDFAGTIEAFTYPEAMYDDILTRRRPPFFNLSYRTQSDGTYQIHLVYNILLGPESHDYQYGDMTPFSWSFTTRPVYIPQMRPTAHVVIDASQAYPETIAAVEDLLYGSDAADAYFPTPTEIFQVFEDNSILQIIDNGDGTWTAIGPDDAIKVFGDGTFEITWPSAVYIDDNTYSIHSL